MKPVQERGGGGSSMRRIGLALLASALVAATAAAASTGRSSPGTARASVEAKVVRQIAAHGQTTFWVVLRDQADLRPARAMRPSPRGRYVYESLTSTANRTQAPLKAWLAQQHVSSKSFWILNTIRVTAGKSVLDELALRPEVQK